MFHAAAHTGAGRGGGGVQVEMDTLKAQLAFEKAERARLEERLREDVASVTATVLGLERERDFFKESEERLRRELKQNMEEKNQASVGLAL